MFHERLDRPDHLQGRAGLHYLCTTFRFRSKTTNIVKRPSKHSIITTHGGLFRQVTTVTPAVTAAATFPALNGVTVNGSASAAGSIFRPNFPRNPSTMTTATAAAAFPGTPLLLQQSPQPLMQNGKKMPVWGQFQFQKIGWEKPNSLKMNLRWL